MEGSRADAAEVMRSDETDQKILTQCFPVSCAFSLHFGPKHDLQSLKSGFYQTRIRRIPGIRKMNFAIRTLTQIGLSTEIHGTKSRQHARVANL